MTVTSHRRPIGEIMVHIERPIARFGQSITFGVRGSDGSLWVGKVDDTGNLMWTPQSVREAVAQPTLFLSDDEVTALYRALEGQPVRARGDASVEHLQDAIQTRDRLLAMVESAHELLMTPVPVYPLLVPKPSESK